MPSQWAGGLHEAVKRVGVHHRVVPEDLDCNMAGTARVATLSDYLCANNRAKDASADASQNFKLFARTEMVAGIAH